MKRIFYPTIFFLVKQWFYRYKGIPFLLIIAGCSTATIFTPYPSKINPLIEEIKTDQFDHALNVLDRHREGKDKILYLLERGRVAQIKSDEATSVKDYETVFSAIKILEEKAVISASDAGAITASLLTNENAIPYKADGYERVFLYHFQALNYLANKDIEGAGVEVRLANEEQKLALERHEKELLNTEKGKERYLDIIKANLSKQVDRSPDDKKTDKMTRTIDEISDKLKSAFQGAFGFLKSDYKKESKVIEQEKTPAEDKELDKQLLTEDKKIEEKTQEILSAANDNLNEAYKSMDKIVSKVKNSFQNAYTFYMSGIVYELLGKDNDAYIDYKKALEIFPENTYLQRDVIRLAKELGILFGKEIVEQEDVVKNIPFEGNYGELVVFFENDLTPQKKEIRVQIPASDGSLAIAFPVYDADESKDEPLLLSEGDSVLGSTEPICYVHALAAKSLKEKTTIMLIRQLLRLAVKAASREVVKEYLGETGQYFSSFYNIASERADLRSWLTLPRDVQIMRLRLPEGAHRINLVHNASGASSDVDVPINKNKKTILRIIRVGKVFYTKPIVF